MKTKNLFRDLNTEIREMFDLVELSDLKRETSDFFVNVFNEVASREKIMVNVPGFSKDDLKISLDEKGYLKISGEKEVEGEIRKIQRSYYIQHLNSLDTDKIQAKVENGLLVINLGKKDESKKGSKEIIIQ